MSAHTRSWFLSAVAVLFAGCGGAGSGPAGAPGPTSRPSVPATGVAPAAVTSTSSTATSFDRVTRTDPQGDCHPLVDEAPAGCAPVGIDVLSIDVDAVEGLTWITLELAAPGLPGLDDHNGLDLVDPRAEVVASPTGLPTSIGVISLGFDLDRDAETGPPLYPGMGIDVEADLFYERTARATPGTYRADPGDLGALVPVEPAPVTWFVRHPTELVVVLGDDLIPPSGGWSINGRITAAHTQDVVSSEFGGILVG